MDNSLRPAAGAAMLAMALVAFLLPAGCGLLQRRPDLGDLSNPAAACRAYESLPAEARSLEAFLGFWNKRDRAFLKDVEDRLARARTLFRDLAGDLAVRFPDRSVAPYRNGLQLHVGGETLYFPLEAFSPGEAYRASGPREIRVGASVEVGEQAMVPVRVDGEESQVGMVKERGRWLRALDVQQRLLLMTQNAYVDGVVEWVRGIARDLDGGRLRPETFDARFQAYLGLYYLTLEPYGLRED